MRPLLFALLLTVAAGCATDDDAAGTTNPGVMTPAEMPVEMGNAPSDSAAADTADAVR